MFVESIRWLYNQPPYIEALGVFYALFDICQDKGLERFLSINDLPEPDYFFWLHSFPRFPAAESKPGFFSQ